MQVHVALNGPLKLDDNGPVVKKDSRCDTIGFSYNWTIPCVPTVVLLDTQDISIKTMTDIEDVRGQLRLQMQVETSLHNHDMTMVSMTVTDSDGTIERVMGLAERPMYEMYVEIKYLNYGGSFSGWRNHEGIWYQPKENWQQLPAYSLMELLSEEMKEANDAKATITLEFLDVDFDEPNDDCCV